MRLLVGALSGLLLSGVAGDALAQGSTTNCRPNGIGGFVCDTSPSPSIDWSRSRTPDFASTMIEARRQREEVDLRRKRAALLDAQIAREQVAGSDDTALRSYRLTVRGSCLAAKEAALGRADLAGFQALSGLCNEIAPD